MNAKVSSNDAKVSAALCLVSDHGRRIESTEDEPLRQGVCGLEEHGLVVGDIGNTSQPKLEAFAEAVEDHKPGQQPRGIINEEGMR